MNRTEKSTVLRVGDDRLEAWHCNAFFRQLLFQHVSDQIEVFVGNASDIILLAMAQQLGFCEHEVGFRRPTKIASSIADYYFQRTARSIFKNAALA